MAVDCFPCGSSTCGIYWDSATARSGVLSFRYSSADAAQVPHTPAAGRSAGAWSAGGIESDLTHHQHTLHALVAARCRAILARGVGRAVASVGERSGAVGRSTPTSAASAAST